MLDSLLTNPILLVVIVIVLLILIAIPVLLRRRRAGQEDLLPPPELGQAVDYTSLPYEEPITLSDRLREAPIGVKLLLALVPIVVIVAAVVLWLTFFSNSGPSTAAIPTPTPAPTLTNVRATLASASRIVVEAETNLPDQTIVTATMKEGDQDFPWFTANRANGEVAKGRISITLERAKDAPTPKRDQSQMITLHTTIGDQVVSSEGAKLSVPSIYTGEFFRDVAIVATAAPTVAPVVVVPTSAPPKPTALIEPTITPKATLAATVFNGGNIRKEPQVGNNVLGQLHAGEVVTLLERSNDSAWYRVKAPEAEGWVSATLLKIDAEMAKQVPTSAPPETGLSAKVFNGGNVRERPVTGKPLDQINAGETVRLLAKTSDGGWYQISYIRAGKPITGWVSISLLTIDSATARQVPIAK